MKKMISQYNTWILILLLLLSAATLYMFFFLAAKNKTANRTESVIILHDGTKFMMKGKFPFCSIFLQKDKYSMNVDSAEDSVELTRIFPGNFCNFYIGKRFFLWDKDEYYMDLNEDRIFDIMFRKSPQKNHVRVGSSWLPYKTFDIKKQKGILEDGRLFSWLKDSFVIQEK